MVKIERSCLMSLSVFLRKCLHNIPLGLYKQEVATKSLLLWDLIRRWESSFLWKLFLHFMRVSCYPSIYFLPGWQSKEVTSQQGSRSARRKPHFLEWRKLLKLILNCMTSQPPFHFLFTIVTQQSLLLDYRWLFHFAERWTVTKPWKPITWH